MKFPLNEKIVLFHISFESFFCSRRFLYVQKCELLHIVLYIWMRMSSVCDRNDTKDRNTKVYLKSSGTRHYNIDSCRLCYRIQLWKKNLFWIRRTSCNLDCGWISMTESQLCDIMLERAVNNLFCFIIMYADLSRVICECDS